MNTERWHWWLMAAILAPAVAMWVLLLCLQMGWVEVPRRAAQVTERGR
jgi:hypothetical protein